jgi:hypothetical protein
MKKAPPVNAPGRQLFWRVLARPAAALGAASIAGAAYLVVSCSGTRRGDFALPFVMSDARVDAQEAWSRETPGFITDLNLARDTGATLVTTRPDYDRPDRPRKFLVTLHDERGRTRWQQTLPFQVKSQDLARDGSLAVVTHYNGEVLAFDADGKRVWSREGNCRPVVLAGPKRVVCWHDDDAEPGTAFELLDWSGQSLGARSVKLDVLAVKPAADERALVLGLTRGQLEFYAFGGEAPAAPSATPAVNPTWKHSLEGEILDVAVSSGESPRVAALYNVPRQGQRVAWFDRAGKALGQPVRPSAHVTQIELTADGSAVVLYGNSPRGQNLLFLEPAAGDSLDSPVLEEKWKVADPRFADYATSMNVAGDLILIGFESLADQARRSQLVGFGRDGRVRFTVPLETSQGAYLYAHGVSTAKGLLVVGTDDARLAAYRLSP